MGTPQEPGNPDPDQGDPQTSPEKKNTSIDPMTDPILRDQPEAEGYKVLGPCVLYETLGRGGMSVVYRGKHLNLDIDVAVKCLEPSLVARDDDFVARFQREAKIAARINHPNVVRVYDVSESGGIHYLVMEYIEGEDARQRVRRKGPLSVEEAVQIILAAAKGLMEAHRRKMVHRDIKPDNILISVYGEVKVADLGLAKVMSSQTGMTLEQSRMGTPQYMPLEQWENVKNAGPQADVWALGATLYFLLAGEDAIQGEGAYQILNRISSEPFPDIRQKRPDVPEAISLIIQHATQKDPSRRYPTAEELVNDLERTFRGVKADLRDPAGIRDQDIMTLVSPPPPKTLAKIKLTISKDSIPDAPADQEGPRPPKKKKALLYLIPAGIAVIVASLLIFAERETPVDVKKVLEPGPTREDSVSGAELARQREEARQDSIASVESTRRREEVRQDSIASAELARQEASGDINAFQRAERMNTIAAYESYIREYPAGSFVDEADGKIQRLKEIAAYDYKMVYVESGTFQMGDEVGNLGKESRPAHSVTLSSFYIGKYEVTQTLWQAVMGENPSQFAGCSKCPVENVSWSDVQEFIEKLNAKTGRNYRLPTEAEWEFSARGGKRDNGYSYSGSSIADDVVWSCENSGNRTHPVGTLRANELGVFDMSGNVLEWCNDLYDENFYESSPQNNPQGPSTGYYRVMRGGHWDDAASSANVAERWSTIPSTRLPTIGFRLARTP